MIEFKYSPANTFHFSLSNSFLNKKNKKLKRSYLNYTHLSCFKKITRLDSLNVFPFSESLMVFAFAICEYINLEKYWRVTKN